MPPIVAWFVADRSTTNSTGGFSAPCRTIIQATADSSESCAVMMSGDTPGLLPNRSGAGQESSGYVPRAMLSVCPSTFRSIPVGQMPEDNEDVRGLVDVYQVEPEAVGRT